MSGNESIDAAHYDQVTTWPRGGLQADIVHIGFGAFHRGHQAVYTDLTNQLSDTHWGIFEINLFGDAQLIENLNAQKWAVFGCGNICIAIYLRPCAFGNWRYSYPRGWHCRSNPEID